MSSCRATPYARARTALACAMLAVMLMPVAAPAGEAESAEQTETAPPAEAETAEAPPAETPVSPELTGEHAAMAREVNLTEAQQQQVIQIVSEANQALMQWRAMHKKQIDEANEALGKARRAGDRDALQRALAEAQPLFRKRFEIQQKYQQKVMDVLTDKQEVQWVGFVLWRTLTGQAEALDLTPEQSEQTRAMSNAAAKKLVALSDDEAATAADAQAAQTIQKNLVDEFVEQVLTDAQRKALKPQAPTPSGQDAPVKAPEKGEAAGEGEKAEAVK
ncbi:MAG: hypothetical protein R6X20_09050 [Phycisphaerae bacterium]